MSTTDVVRIAQGPSSPEEEQGRLKADLQYLRRRGLLKASGELGYQGRKCARCGAPFGRFYNTGASCTRCRHRVCRQCRIEVRGPTDNKDVEWICNICYKIAELHVVTGKWIYENPIARESVGEQASPSPVDILKHTIRRAWTINGPPTRWSAARKSPELRIYRSLPSRHQQQQEEYREGLEGNEEKSRKSLVKESSRSEESQTICSDKESLTKDEALNVDSKDLGTRNESLSSTDKVPSRSNSNERTNAKRNEVRASVRQEEEVPSPTSDAIKLKKSDRSAVSPGAKSSRLSEPQQEESASNQEQSTTLRVSLIKPPRILSKLISPEIKPGQAKHGERKSNIPIFKRSSREFEDIRSPQESSKRSLIPQRYRGSTDDLRRSREDISLPSLIPKLLTPRSKEVLKRQDSKDDIRPTPKTSRRDSKEETPRFSPLQVSSASNKDEIGNSKIIGGGGIRIFRRDGSKEDVGRESTNSNVSACVATKGKQACSSGGKEERQERAEEKSVGDSTASKSKSVVSEQQQQQQAGRTKSSYALGESKEIGAERRETTRGEEENCCERKEKSSAVTSSVDDIVLAREEATTMLDVTDCNAKTTLEAQEVVKEATGEVREGEGEEEEDEEEEEKRVTGERKSERMLSERATHLENDKSPDDSAKDIVDALLDNSDIDVPGIGAAERKGATDFAHGKKQDDFQVVRRKFPKEELSNPDDTDDTPNKRCSSHLSPEASPLSTRSSRYSPRESESEPTPALPRKTGGDSCSASQRIRDAITRTRRESNSSARYESSGSESVRLSETGLHGYVELARKVKFFGGTGSGALSSAIGCDEVVHRDSATSAGEDEPHDDGHGRTGPVPSQGRTMLRRRRQFDAQGSRRRGRSHARTCCGEDLQSLQTLQHVIGGHGDGHQSPTQAQDQQSIVDYRRLVFISSDSSSGREEDDADSSCSSSSYLNGLPRGGGHAQSLEDCDWDYFESGSLPLPSGVPLAIGTTSVGTDAAVPQDWSCCPGRGSSACQACGGSRGANVLPVPVPIPVPVPYPVPVPAALWTGDFAAAASSMISRAADNESGTLRLRGDPAAPWFAWHPRFNQPLQGTRLDPRLASAFDPATCTFRPDHVIAPRLYGASVEPTNVTQPENFRYSKERLGGSDSINRDERDEARIKDVLGTKIDASVQNEVTSTIGGVLLTGESKVNEQSLGKDRGRSEEAAGVLSSEREKDIADEKKDEGEKSEKGTSEDSLGLSYESREDRMYQRLREDSGSSSGRSSADSSDLEDDSSSHRFSRVFVVNDDSLTSDNDIEDNGEEDDSDSATEGDSDSATEGGVTLKRVTPLADEEPVILQHVRLLSEDSSFEKENVTTNVAALDAESKSYSKASKSGKTSGLAVESSVKERNSNHYDKRRSRGRRNHVEMDSDDSKVPILLKHRPISEEIYLADENDFSENRVKLKSVKALDPDNIETNSVTAHVAIGAMKGPRCEFGTKETSYDHAQDDDMDIADAKSSSTWDSNIIPDSLEISKDELTNDEDDLSFKDFDAPDAKIRASSPTVARENDVAYSLIIPGGKDNCETVADKRTSLSQTSVAAGENASDRGRDSNRECDVNSLDLNSMPSVTLNSGAASTTDSSITNETTTGSEISSDELHEYEVTPAGQPYYHEEPTISAFNRILYNATRKPNQEKSMSIRAARQMDGSARIKRDNRELNGTCPLRRITPRCEKKSSVEERSLEINSNLILTSQEDTVCARLIDDSTSYISADHRFSGGNARTSRRINTKDEPEGNDLSKDQEEAVAAHSEEVFRSSDASDATPLSAKIQEILKCAESGAAGAETAHDGGSCTVRGENPGSNGQVVGDVCGGGGGGDGGSGVSGTGDVSGGSDGAGGGSSCGEGSGSDGGGGCAGETSEEGSTRFRSVERRPSAGKENGFPSAATAKDSARDAQHFPLAVANNNNSGGGGGSSSSSSNSGGGGGGGGNNNRYRSLVMITQEASYQPVSVITSDTTTLLRPDEVHSAGQGLAGYFQLALEAVTEQPHRKNGQGPRRPLMVKRLGSNATNQPEPEVDSGLSVGSASESDDVSVKNVSKVAGGRQDNGDEGAAKERALSNNNAEHREGSRTRVSSQSSDDNSGSGGVVILEEGLADDDSWVEEVSHDEDEPGATTATEESSEDEANNLGDREEELRGYHRQAIDFTLHTIVEESCEESEAEPSLATGSPSKKQRPPSASELEKYFFFGLGGDGNNSSMGSREVDSLSETSSIYSEGLESLGQDEASANGQVPDRSGSGDGYLNSSRLEKYFLSEFLGFDQDRRDSDGSVGSDSEGRPSPEAQRRKRLVRARGTGRSHSSSLDNLLALAQSSQNLSSQNSLQDLSLNPDAQELESEGSSTETDGAEDAQTPVFGTDGQFDTVKRKKKKPRNLGTQSPRVSDDRNKTPEPAREMVLVGEVVVEGDVEAVNSEDSDRAKTPQPEIVLSSSSSSPSNTTNTSTTASSVQIESTRSLQMSPGDSTMYNQRSKQQSRDSGFVGSCDDLLQHQKVPDDGQTSLETHQETGKDRPRHEPGDNFQANHQTTSEGVVGSDDKGNSSRTDHVLGHTALPHLANASLSRKDSFNNWSSDEETNLMMSKMRQFFKTMVATSNGQGQNAASANSSGASPAPSPRLTGYSSKAKLCTPNRTKPPQLVYFENELTRLMKTVPGIRDDQVREIVEYLSSEDTWSDSYDSSDYTSSDLEGAAGGRRSALQEQISQSCQQIISKFDTTSGDNLLTDKDRDEKAAAAIQPPCIGRDTAFVYQKLVQSFTKMAGDGVSSDTSSTPHSSPPLIAKVMHHIGSRLVALMHEVSEGGPAVQHHSTSWRRYSQHHRTPSSASTTEDDDSTSDSTNAPSSAHLQLPRSKSHDPLLLINSHPAASTGQEGEEREASDYERFSWRGSFESALMAADSRTKLSLLACSGDVSVGANTSASALAMAAKRRSAGDLLFNPKSFSREQLDRVRSCGSIGGGSGGGASGGGSIEERIWSNRRRSSVPDANTRGESGASAGDEDTEDELEYGGESRATTLPRGMQSAMTAATNSLPRLPASTAPTGLTSTSTTAASSVMHKAHSVYHFLPQHTGVKSARYRPPGFARNTNVTGGGMGGPKRAVSAPGLQVSGSQANAGKRENSRSRRQQAMSLTPDDGSSLSEACSTPIIGAGSRASSSHTVMDMDDMEPGLHSGHLATRASLSSLGARSDSMASVYSGAGEGRCCRSVVVTGEVEFALQYDYKHLTFEVHVTKCKNLAPVDVKRKRSDPYVKVYLLPDKSKSGKRKTKVKKHTLNPEFNETLKFHMSLSGLETRTLWLTVWHSDMFGRNDFLGEVRMPLENKIFDDPTPRWYPLQERTEPFDDPVAYKGEVIVGLKFVPPDPAQQQERERETGSDHRGPAKTRKNWSRGALHVLVKEARNLQTRAKNSGTCDPFCKSYLLPDKGRSGKQKTGVVRRSGGSPVWGHTFIYKDVSLQELAERGLELTVWDHDRIASNEFLGGVRFNLGTGKHYGKPVDWMDATGRELSLWQSMLERPNFWVEGAVTLRPNLHNHGKNNGS